VRLGLVTIVAIGVASAWAEEDPGPRRSLQRWQPCSVSFEHLKLRDGRTLYRVPAPTLRDREPFLVAASDAERDAGHGFAVGVDAAQRLFEAPTTANGARELCRLLGGGTLIPDAETFARMRAAALKLAPQADGWGITVAEAQPKAFGASARAVAGGFEVQRLVLTNSGYGRLDVETQRFTVSAEGALKVERTPWITGPPRSWQTAGEVDEAEQAALRAEVDRFLQAMTQALAPARTLQAFVDVCAPETLTFAQVRWALGEPDADEGSGLHIYRYTLGDGTAVVFGTGGEDDPLTYACQVKGSKSKPGWTTLRELR